MLKNLYFLGIIPPDEIAAEITQMKQFCADNYNCRHALSSPPHITLVPPFRMETSEVHGLDTMIKATVKTLSPFFIELNGFDHFSNRVVFVNVENNKHLVSINLNFVKIIDELIPLEKTKNSRFHAHLTIAFKDINPKKFDAIWDHFQRKPHNRIFECKELFLLNYKSGHWDISKKYKLGK